MLNKCWEYAGYGRFSRNLEFKKDSAGQFLLKIPDAFGAGRIKYSA